MQDLQALISRSASDKSLRARLIANPGAVLQEAGFAPPAGARIEVVENQPNEIHLEIGEKNRPPQLQTLLDRAQSDAGFRQQLLKEPKQRVEEAFGKSLPSGTVVRVHEPLTNGIRLFLPPQQPAQDDELSEQELGAVAGGAFGAGIKGLIHDIREWVCKDTAYVIRDDQGNTSMTGLYTSHDPGVTLRPSDPTL